MKKYNLSIVIPVYNEEGSIKKLYEQINHSVLLLSEKEPDFNYEIIFVNDGSTDGTYKLINQIIRADNNVKLISFYQNKGKSEALNCAFKFSSGEIVITLDGDLQDDPIEFKNLINKLEEGADMVTGWKKNRKDPLAKRIPSKIFNFVLRILTNIKIHDFNCGLKAYKRYVIKNIDIYGGLHRFIPVLAKQKGFTISEIVVNHRARKFGFSKYGTSRLFHGFYDLITILFLNKYFNRPLHLFGLLGFILFISGFFINLNLTYKWFFHSEWITPYKNPIFFLGILLIIVGMQFFSTGLIGELIVYFNKKRNYINEDIEFINYDK
tara:strand:- start:230 stop:1198 length:969 start_codon:yes stop_codon:yes gene_type:complete